MEFLVWLENTPIANAIRTIPWLYPAFETGHYIGLSLLVGGIMLIDLRVLGMARGLPLQEHDRPPAVRLGRVHHQRADGIDAVHLWRDELRHERRVPAQDGVHGASRA